jgi:hypothetical protein
MSTQESHNPTIFISHAGPDSDFARWIAESLGKVGIKAHLDQVEIKVGDNIVTWMNDAAEESDYLLLLLSPLSVDRYWVKVEWSNALMKEAALRRTFVIPAILPGLDDSKIPFLLSSKLYLDFREDTEKALLQLISRLKEDELVHRDLGSYPSPAPISMVKQVEKAFPDAQNTIEVIIHSNRFGRNFRLQVPANATPSYIMGMLRDVLHLKFSNIDEVVGVELSYTYYLKHNGEAITLNTPLEKAGVQNGDRLEFWIHVTLRDLIEDKEIGEKVFFHLYKIGLDQITDDIRRARKRAFSSAEIAHIASKFFAHVDV